jgi:hypothetical protein
MQDDTFGGNMGSLSELGISVLYLTFLGIGILYALILMVTGALHGLHVPGVEFHVGTHDFGPVDISTVPDAHLGDVSHPSVKVPSLVTSDDVSMVTAAEQFLSKRVNEVQNVALQTLEGHLRAIVGTMTVEEIYNDRDKFAQRVQEVSAMEW